MQPYSPPLNTAPCTCEMCSQSVNPLPASPSTAPQSPEEGSIPVNSSWHPGVYAPINTTNVPLVAQTPSVFLPFESTEFLLPESPAVYLPAQHPGSFAQPYGPGQRASEWPRVMSPYPRRRPTTPPVPLITPDSAYAYFPANVYIQQSDINNLDAELFWTLPEETSAVPSEHLPLTQFQYPQPPFPIEHPSGFEYPGGFEYVGGLLSPVVDFSEYRKQLLGRDYTAYGNQELPSLQQDDGFFEGAEDVKVNMNENENEAGGAEMKSAQELADLERLSQAYQPEVSGPLVGELQSSSILQDEYAGADSTFVKKTAALAPKYSNYRPVKGDGNCGWRALAFGYFELLLRTGDVEFIKYEQARIKSMNSLMDDVGMSEYLYEDFVDETMQLLSSIQESPVIDNPYDDKHLLATFNAEDKSNGIVTHLRLLTAGFLKLNPAPYEPFIENSIQEFCATVVEPFNVQIDHIAVKALIDLLFIPAGFAVEISYLDRSVGDEVNVHRFEDENGTAPTVTPKTRSGEAPTLRLLYRPGHYDLIYKNGDLAPAALPSSSKGKEPAVQVSMMLGQQYDKPSKPKAKAAPSNNKRQRTKATASSDISAPTWFCTPPPSKEQCSDADATCNPFRYQDGKQGWYGGCTCKKCYDPQTKISPTQFTPRYAKPITLAQLENPSFVVPTSDAPQPLQVDEIPQQVVAPRTPMILMGKKHLQKLLQAAPELQNEVKRAADTDCNPMDLDPYEAQLAAQEDQHTREKQFTHYDTSHYQNFNFQPQSAFGQ
ncbi:hypothetical protein TWF696_005369 [Orbilia brochopaga]|uniref:ubiquitinyl hydrolase 1 n=1 Tax=Orbilia brochopaga TaxID=3140254 RepID=A0AAV9V0Z0_9PEZI